MGLFNKIKQAFSPVKLDEPDTCASSYPEWKPSGTWSPQFEDDLTPEDYDGN